MISLVSLVSLVSLAVSGVMAVQRWEEQPSSTFVNPGGEVSLACRIANKKGDCRWEMRQEDGSTNPLGIYPGKREWAGDREAGDCSIRILEADFNIDNGRYVCQVTASGFRETDTLISREAILSVRVPPSSVTMRSRDEEVGVSVSGAAGEPLEVECTVMGGNPPPRLHWFVGSRRVEGSQEVENREARTVTSRLSVTATKEEAGDDVRCVVEHSALNEEMEAVARLEIQFSPEVTLDASQREISTVEGGTVNVTCHVTANPPASVTWRHLNSGQVVSLTNTLELPAISRNKAGRFVCEATNSLGTTQSEETLIDVKYGATVISVDPQGSVDKLYNRESVEFRCHAEANPLPVYSWVRHTPGGSVVLSHERTLRLAEVRYEDQGEYHCEVSNDISSSRSEPVSLRVHGPPRVNSDNKHLFLIEGTDASIEVEFCGSPLPKQTWQIESVESKLSLVAGTSHDMFTVEKERKSTLDNCYISTLHILSIDQTATKDYILRLENEHGEEVHRAHVTVGEEMAREIWIGSLVGVIALFLLVLCLTVCWCRRCCRHSDKQLKPDPERPL